MATYQELLAQMRALDARIEKARGQAAAEALETVRASVAEFGFTPADVFGRAPGRKAAKASKAQAAAPAGSPHAQPGRSGDNGTLDMFSPEH